MKRERMVGTRLPGYLVRDLERIEEAEQADRATTLRRLLARAIGEWKIEHFARQYGAGKLTLARAAREAGVSLWEFQAYVRGQRIPAQYDLEDLAHDLRAMETSYHLGPRDQRVPTRPRSGNRN
jgi:predicted HTH domain antitoxin